MFNILLLLIMAVDNTQTSEIAKKVFGQPRVERIMADYLIQRVPSDYYVALRTNINKKGLNIEKVRQNLTNGSLVKWIESVDKGFSIGISRLNSLGQKTTRTDFCWDGKNSYELSFTQLDKELNLPSVTLNKTVSDPLNNENPLRMFLANYVLLGDVSLDKEDGNILNRKKNDLGNSTLDQSQEDQHKFSTVNLKKSIIIGDIKHEIVFKLRPDLGYAIEECLDEAVYPTGGRVATMHWQVDGFDKAINSYSDKDFFYPKKISKQTFDSKGNHYFSETITVSRFEINPDLKAFSFTPMIEDGTNVCDFRTKRITVFGNRISPRLQKLIEKRVEESKALINKEQPSIEMESTEAPKSYLSHVSSILIGIASLSGFALTSLVLKNRFYFEPTSTGEPR